MPGFYDETDSFPAADDRATDRLLPAACAPWPSFADILRRLHRERIYIHPEQLAEFLLAHGLPVDLCYVPTHLQSKAARINANYRGDGARLEARADLPQQFGFE